jgi:hypothetical protein
LSSVFIHFLLPIFIQIQVKQHGVESRPHTIIISTFLIEFLLSYPDIFQYISELYGLNLTLFMSALVHNKIPGDSMINDLYAMSEMSRERHWTLWSEFNLAFTVSVNWTYPPISQVSLPDVGSL